MQLNRRFSGSIWEPKNKKSLLLFNNYQHARTCVCARTEADPPALAGIPECKTSSGSPGGCFILEWAARWREDGGCFPALKAPELAPLTNRAASSLWGDSSVSCTETNTKVSLPAPPGSAQPHALLGHSSAHKPRQVAHSASNLCLFERCPYWKTFELRFFFPFLCFFKKTNKL